jgi:hypothetical protein
MKLRVVVADDNPEFRNLGISRTSNPKHRMIRNHGGTPLSVTHSFLEE